MCTALRYEGTSTLFGRNLDFDFSYGESLVFLPRNLGIAFHDGSILNHHKAILGVAHVAEDYPLLYDGMNEDGLAIAGLNFVGNARFYPDSDEKKNIAQYEFMLYLLSTCSTIKEVEEKVKGINITGTPFSNFTPSQLHYMAADKTGSIVIENKGDALAVYPNKTDVLTNNPPFEMQLFHLNNYQNLTPEDPENRFSAELDLRNYSRGMGAIGLPGDLSSMSRFVKAAFTRLNASKAEDESSTLSQYFHIIASVEQQKGLCRLGHGKEEYTIYTSCYHLGKKILFYRTYDSMKTHALRMPEDCLEEDAMQVYPMLVDREIVFDN